MALGPRGRETEAGEAGTRLSYGAGQWRAASNPGSHLKPSARLVLSHPPLPAMETPSPPLAPSRPPLPAPPTPPAEPSLSRPRPGASSGRAPTQPSRPDVASWPPNWAPGVTRFLLLGLPTSACATLAGLQSTRNPQALPAFSPRLLRERLAAVRPRPSGTLLANQGTAAVGGSGGRGGGWCERVGSFQSPTYKAGKSRADLVRS